MKITYITASSYIDTVLPLVTELTKKNFVNLIINVTNNTRNTSFFDLDLDYNKNKIIELNTKEFKEWFNIIENKKNIKVTIIYWKSLKVINLFNLFYSLKLRKFINKADLIHIDFLSWHYLLVIKLLRKNFIVDFHDFLPYNSKREKITLKLLKIIYVNLSKGIVIHNNKISEKIKLFHKKLINKTFISYFGAIPLKKVYPPKLEKNVNNFIVLFFGRIASYKGIELIVEATKILLEKYPNILTILAGQGNYYFDIKDLYKHPNFLIKNYYINNQELSDLIFISDVILCPYRDISQSGVVMTAFDFNKPVIATDVGSFNEFVIDGKTGFLIPPGDSLAVANAIEKLILNPQLIEKMSLEIELLKNNHFNWSLIAEKLLEFYKKKL